MADQLWLRTRIREEEEVRIPDQFCRAVSVCVCVCLSVTFMNSVETRNRIAPLFFIDVSAL